MKENSWVSLSMHKHRSLFHLNFNYQNFSVSDDFFIHRFSDSSPTRKYNEDGATEKDEDDQSRRSSSQDDYPSLQPENVVSILVSASFLKMEPLVTVGLRYVHSNMNKILSATHNINCLGEPLLSR